MEPLPYHRIQEVLTLLEQHVDYRGKNLTPDELKDLHKRLKIVLMKVEELTKDTHGYETEHVRILYEHGKISEQELRRSIGKNTVTPAKLLEVARKGYEQSGRGIVLITSELDLTYLASSQAIQFFTSLDHVSIAWVELSDEIHHLTKTYNPETHFLVLPWNMSKIAPSVITLAQN